MSHEGKKNEHCSDKALGRNCDDREPLAVERYFLANDVWIATEALFPACITDDCKRTGTCYAILFLSEKAARSRMHAQYIKVIPRNNVAPDALAIAFATEAHRSK